VSWYEGKLFRCSRSYECKAGNGLLHVASGDPDEKMQEQLDDAVDMIFPASDPIAIPTLDKADWPRRLHS
jgi:hypothetical protein